MLIFGAIRADSLGYTAHLLAEYVTCMCRRNDMRVRTKRGYAFVDLYQKIGDKHCVCVPQVTSYIKGLKGASKRGLSSDPVK
jgi:hypothetical protein